MNNSEILSNFNKITRQNKSVKNNILCRPLNFMKNTKFLGKGQYGKVYRGKLSQNSKKYVVYKSINTNDPVQEKVAYAEYDIAKKLNSENITGIPKVYKIKTCEKSSTSQTRILLYSEFIDGLDGNGWIKSKKTINEWEWKSIIIQVVYTLYKIHKKFPTFRHHDLHLGNIMIKNVETKDIIINLSNENFKINNAGLEVAIIDFGFSSMSGVSNPMAMDEDFKNLYGIYPNSSISYDLHFFLNAIYNYVSRCNPTITNCTVKNSIKQLIMNIIPQVFLGRGPSKGLNHFRLQKNFNKLNRRIPSHQYTLSIINKRLKNPPGWVNSSKILLDKIERENRRVRIPSKIARTPLIKPVRANNKKVTKIGNLSPTRVKQIAKSLKMSLNPTKTIKPVKRPSKFSMFRNPLITKKPDTPKYKSGTIKTGKPITMKSSTPRSMVNDNRKSLLPGSLKRS